MCIAARCCGHLTKRPYLCTLYFYSSNIKQVVSLYRQKFTTLRFHEIIVSAVTTKWAKENCRLAGVNTKPEPLSKQDASPKGSHRYRESSKDLYRENEERCCLLLSIILHSALRSKLLPIFHLLITSQKSSVLGRDCRGQHTSHPIDSKLIWSFNSQLLHFLGW